METITQVDTAVRDDDPKCKVKVLLLTLGHAPASGLRVRPIARLLQEMLIAWFHSNLTSANHVIFVSPFLAPTQYHNDSNETQAIERAYRMGQKEDVHIYHSLALKTLDVVIFEARKECVVVRDANGAGFRDK